MKECTIAGVMLFAAATGFAAVPSAPKLVLDAEAARLSPERVEVVAQESFPGKKGVALNVL